MKKIISFITILVVTSAGTAWGAAANCGDGNHHYDLFDQGETVFYAGLSEDFIVTKQAENKITIEDTVDCRFGKDSLIDIVNIKFLDKTITVENLIIESATQQLKQGYLALLLANALQAILGEKETEEKMQEKEQEIEENTVFVNTDFGNTFGSNNISGVTISSSAFGNVPSSNTGFNSAFPVGSFSGSATAGQATFTTTQPSTSFNTAPVFTSNTGFIPGVPVANQNPFSTFGAQSTQQFTQVAPATVVAWDPATVGVNSIVYFETTDSAGNHYYMGAASGNTGAAQVEIPRALLNQSVIKVFIKTGTRVIGTYNIRLQ